MLRLPGHLVRRFREACNRPGGIIELFKLLTSTATTNASPARNRCIARVAGKLLHGIDHAKPVASSTTTAACKTWPLHHLWSVHDRKGVCPATGPAEITTLAARVGTIRCNGCGAPVDIRHNHACTHCRAPIAILDADAVEQALARYQHAEIKRTTINVDALGDAIVMRANGKNHA